MLRKSTHRQFSLFLWNVSRICCSQRLASIRQKTILRALHDRRGEHVLTGLNAETCGPRLGLERFDTRGLAGDVAAFAYGPGILCWNRYGGGSIRWHHDTQPHHAAINSPVRHNASAYGIIFAACPGQPAARLGPNVKMPVAGRLFVWINAGDGAPHPLTYRTDRPVVKRMHLLVLKST